MILAQLKISGFWDGAPHLVPHSVQSLLVPLYLQPPTATLAHSCSLSNKCLKKKRRIYLFETFWFICYPLLVATSVFLFSLVAFFNFLTVGISQCYVPSHFFTSCVYQCLQLYLLRTPEFKQIQNWTISLSSFLLEFLFLVSDVLRFWLTWYNQTSFQNTSYLLKALQIICQRLRIVHITKVKRPKRPYFLTFYSDIISYLRRSTVARIVQRIPGNFHSDPPGVSTFYCVCFILSL